MDKFEQLKKALGKACKENELMSSHTTLQIGGPARLFVDVRKEDGLIKCVKLAEKNKVKYIIIGEGSNLLVSDKGFGGLVIKNSVSGYVVSGNKVKVKSGTVLQDFISFIIKKGFSGMEKMSGIPGTIGGAVRGNVGAYGQAVSDKLIKVKVFDGKNIKWFTKEKCEFDYRDSVFKKNTFIILEVEFEFEKTSSEILKKVSLNTILIRSQKYPPGILCPGSFFKNILANKLKKNILDKIPEEKIMYGKIPAGFLMEAVGAKCAQKGNIKIADYHGNLIVNLGKGSASDFIDLAETYAKKVEKKFGIKLEPEVQLVGFDKNNGKSER